MQFFNQKFVEDVAGLFRLKRKDKILKSEAHIHEIRMH